MTLNRRSFLRMVGLAGGGLLVGFDLSGCASPQTQRMIEAAKDTGNFHPSAFLTITPDDRILVGMNKSEMGQGVMTGIATLLAEELEVPVERLELFHTHEGEFEVSVGEASIDTGGLVGMQITGGSSSTPENYTFVRKAGASARMMLIQAAATMWNVPPNTCTAVNGVVRHTSGKQARYGQLTKRAARMDIVDDPPLKKKRDFTQIGKRRTRVDALDKSTGRAAFGTDLHIPDKVCAHIIRPPIMGAPVKTLDAREARKLPGVVDILKFERGVAVVAHKYWQARNAAMHVEVTWGQGKLEGFHTATLRRDARAQTLKEGTHSMRSDGDAFDVLEKRSEDHVDLVFDFPFLAHATMEPMNATVRVNKDTVDVWAPNQSPTIMAEAVSRVMEIPRSQVRVTTTMLGGGFGRRAVPDFVLEALLIAKRLEGQPVQVIWTREDDTQAGYYRPQGAARARGTIAKDGSIEAASLHLVVQGILPDQSTFAGGLFPDWMPIILRKLTSKASAGFLSTGTAPDFLATEGLADTPYTLPNYALELTPIRTPIPLAFWRSVGHSYSGFLMESFIDALAHKAKADPVTFRENHLATSPRHLQVLRKAVALSDWGKPLEEGWGRGVAVHKSFGTYVAQVVEAGLVDGHIRCRKVWCACDCGVIINPDIVRAQLESGIIFGLSAAIYQKIEIVDGHIQQANFDTYPALRMFESPDIHIELIDSNAKPTGIGEPGLPPSIPALANALFQATGVRLTSLPLQDAWNAHTQNSNRTE